MSLAWRVLQWLIWHIWKNRLLNRLEVVCVRHLSFSPVFGFESVISGSVWWSLSTCKRKSRARLRYWQIRMQKGLLWRGENYRCVCPRGGDVLCSFIRRYTMRLSDSPSIAAGWSEQSLYEKSRMERSLASNPFAACAPSWFILGDQSCFKNRHSCRLDLILMRYQQQVTLSNFAEPYCWCYQGPQVSRYPMVNTTWHTWHNIVSQLLPL